MLAHKRRYTFIPIPSPPTAKTPATSTADTTLHLLFCFLAVWSIRDEIVGFHDATRLLSYIFHYPLV